MNNYNVIISEVCMIKCTSVSLAFYKTAIQSKNSNCKCLKFFYKGYGKLQILLFNNFLRCGNTKCPKLRPKIWS